MNLNNESPYFNANKLYALTCSIKGDYKQAEEDFRKAGIMGEANRMRKIHRQNLQEAPLRIVYKAKNLENKTLSK